MKRLRSHVVYTNISISICMKLYRKHLFVAVRTCKLISVSFVVQIVEGPIHPMSAPSDVTADLVY